nr:MAG TPA: Lipopolysaccharide export system ATP-binding protein transport, ABC-transporter, LIPID TRANSPORT [Crassvirales sp.]
MKKKEYIQIIFLIILWILLIGSYLLWRNML